LGSGELTEEAQMFSLSLRTIDLYFCVSSSFRIPLLGVGLGKMKLKNKNKNKNYVYKKKKETLK
jgi:hypothetical protein